MVSVWPGLRVPRPVQLRTSPLPFTVTVGSGWVAGPVGGVTVVVPVSYVQLAGRVSVTASELAMATVVLFLTLTSQRNGWPARAWLPSGVDLVTTRLGNSAARVTVEEAGP